MWKLIAVGVGCFVIGGLTVHFATKDAGEKVAEDAAKSIVELHQELVNLTIERDYWITKARSYEERYKIDHND